MASVVLEKIREVIEKFKDKKEGEEEKKKVEDLIEKIVGKYSRIDREILEGFVKELQTKGYRYGEGLILKEMRRLKEVLDKYVERGLGKKFLDVFKWIVDRKVARKFVEVAGEERTLEVLDKYVERGLGKKFLDVFKGAVGRNKKLERYLKLLEDISLGVKLLRKTNYIRGVLKDNDLLKVVEEEGLEGYYKIATYIDISEITSSVPKPFVGKEWYKKLKEWAKKKFVEVGKYADYLSLVEFGYVLRGYINLGNKERKGLLNVLELIVSSKYWQDPEVQNIVRAMENVGINTDALKGDAWVYALEGRIVSELPDYEKALRALPIALIGSRDKGKLKNAWELIANIVGKDKLRYAAQAVRQLPGRKRGKLIDLYKRGKYEKILDKLEELVEWGMQLKGRKKNVYEALHDTLQAVKGLRKGRVAGGKYLIGYYGRHVSLMFDNETVLSCSQLPSGVNKYGAVVYQLDPRVVTIGYKFVDEYDPKDLVGTVEEEPDLDGLVIGYIAMGKVNGEEVPILLVDSVEGGNIFLSYLRGGGFEKVYSDIMRVARNIGARYVVFNRRVFNTTPEEFLNELKKRKSGKIVSVYTKIIGDKKIPHNPYMDRKQYLEAYGGWSVPEGTVKGYVYEVK